MAKKIQYRSMDVEQVRVAQVLAQFPEGSRVVVGIDVAKRNFVAALCDESNETRLRVHFEHPRQTLEFVDLLNEVREQGCTVEAVMEPTGTYGDPLRYQLGIRSIPVFRVTNKHVADAAEVFDGCPSKHDNKDASVIAWLHGNKRSKLWLEVEPERRAVRALVARRELYDGPMRKVITQMEPILARHFPEFEQFFDLSRRKTPHRLLEHFGSPSALAKAGEAKVSELIQKFSRKKPEEAFVHELVQAAHSTTGTGMHKDEIQLVRLMAGEVLRLMELRAGVDKLIEEAMQEIPSTAAMRTCVGAVTAAVVFAYLGDPRNYGSAAAYEKAAGLNLVESSSGTNPKARDEVVRRISKRGPGIVRKYLFLAAMRLVQKDRVSKAWYQRRRGFVAEQRTKAIIAVERKLCRALFHVAKGQPFDANRLFDARRLGLETPVCTEAT